MSDRYKVVQNEKIYAYTDRLLGEGVTYETAESLQNGKHTWILAKLPQPYTMSDDENTLNLALSLARHSWSTNHAGDTAGKTMSIWQKSEH